MSGGEVQDCGDLKKLSLIAVDAPSRKEPKKEKQKKNWNLM